MPFIWSDKATREQLEINRLEQANALPESRLSDDLLLPTLVKAVEDIAPGSSGNCDFMRGPLSGSRAVAGERRLMYNLVSASPILSGEEALAQRVMLSQSGEAGWVVFRIPKVGTSGKLYECEDCTNGTMPGMQLQITLLEELTAAPDDNTYDGWHEHVNGVHALSHEAPFSPCAPGILFILPDNRQLGGNPTISGKLMIRLIGAEHWNSAGGAQFGEIQPLTTLLFLQGEDVNLMRPNQVMPKEGVGLAPVVVYQENGSNLMTRTIGTDNRSRIDCDQTYSDYVENVDLTNTNLDTWLANGTFTINP